MTQDDALFALSTVRETLLFAARLRLPKTTGDEALAERVDAVIRELGLVKVRDTVVGSDKIRGVSGGERKRVNIGIELCMILSSCLWTSQPAASTPSRRSP